MNNTPENEEKSIGKEKKPLSKKAIIRIVSISLAVLIAILAIVLPVTLTQCGRTKSIKVTSLGGLGLPEISVTVYDGTEVVASGETDENGSLAVDLGKKEYSVTLDNLPDGYIPESSYKITAGEREVKIAVRSEIVKAEIPEGKTFTPGDVMYDFTIANAYIYKEDAITMTPEPVSLAELAEGKKCIILNFFFTTCSPCRAEIPAMLEAYNEHAEADDVLILGISNYATDSDSLVAAFVNEFKANYYMGMDSANIINRFVPSVNNFPTTIMIDRYGVIAERHVGSQPTAAFWRNEMAKYTNDNYSTAPVNPDDDGTFVPDMPADFGVEFTKNPQEISDRINNTGVSVTFSADSSAASWPWKLADDGQSIVTTNAGHLRTPAIIYAELNVPKDKVLVFDYKVSAVEDTDYFYVAVDGKRGMGHQTIQDTGENKWKEGYAYIALEEGRHDIAFMYFKFSDSEAVKGYDDAVYIKNLRLEDVNDVIREKNLQTDMPYFAVRGANAIGGYDIYEDVYIAADGFYYLRNHQSSAGDPAMLYCDLAHATPFFTSPTASIYSEYIAQNKCTFNGTNYYDTLTSFNSWAANSTVSNLVPVTRELQRALNAIYTSVVPATAPYYNPNGWLEFCAFFKHYGAGESLGNPIVGLSYFTAIEAHETTYMADTSGTLNSFTFDRLIMPRGILFKFVPERTSVYNIRSIGKLGTMADLYDDSLRINGISHIYGTPINSCGDDNYQRNMGEGYDYDNPQFTMYHYLEQGKTYYIAVLYASTETLGTLEFRIDDMKVDHYEYLTSATAGFLVLGANNTYRVPVYTDVEFVNGVYCDTLLHKPLYCDFIDTSRMFNLYSIGTLIGKQGTQEFEKKAFDFSGYGTSIEINGETYQLRDYTADMERYYDEAVQNKGDIEGMHVVDKTLHDVLVLFYYFTFGFDDYNEWLTACYFYDFTDENKPMPNTITRS